MAPTTMSREVRVLTLLDGQKQDAVLYRLEKGWVLRFTLAPDLSFKQVRLFCNYPLETDVAYNRNTFYELPWSRPESTLCKHDLHTDRFVEIIVSRAGSFRFFFTTDRSEKEEAADGYGYFHVDCTLACGPSSAEEVVPLDAIQCQTVLSKLLGPFPEWETRLRVSKESGYNMVHFTPLQELGKSKSAYCLKDQLKLNSSFSPSSSQGKAYTMDDVAQLVEKMKSEWHVLSMADLVYNHTANETEWLKDNPQCTYNIISSPHLRPAFLYDRILYHFNMEVSRGEWAHKGVPAFISEGWHVQNIRSVLQNDVIPLHFLHEFYTVDVSKMVELFKKRIISHKMGSPIDTTLCGDLVIIQDHHYRRNDCSVNIDLAMANYYLPLEGSVSNEEERLQLASANFESRLNDLNNGRRHEIEIHVQAGLDNFIANVNYRFLAEDGPKVGQVMEENPLMFNYFTFPGESHDLQSDEYLMDSDNGQFCMAHNGWVMGDDPLRNFAEPGSMVYLRRELISWGDSVKLRYGSSREESPFLWDYMLKYTQETARIFHAVRLDNCHSTPLNVAEFMLDEARKIRPDLYICAELFTGSEYQDNIFTNRLGITSLIREALSAWDAHEEGRLVHRYGGDPVGAFLYPKVKPLLPSVAHAIFMDQTHDNPSAVEKRSAYDLLPSAGLVAIACCASGSNRGYDELVPHHINVVTESRPYAKWSEDGGGRVATPAAARMEAATGAVSISTGIIAAKLALNRLHHHLGSHGYSQIYVHDLSGDTVSVTRRNPVTQESVILISRCAFSHPSNPNDGSGVPAMLVEGNLVEVVLEAEMVHSDRPAHLLTSNQYVKSNQFINGLSEYSVRVREFISFEESHMMQVVFLRQNQQKINFINFKPGSVIAFKVRLGKDSESSVAKLHNILSQLGYSGLAPGGTDQSGSSSSGGDCSADKLIKIVNSLGLCDLNRVLFRCGAEEWDDGNNVTTYNIPNYGRLVYCGLQGFMSVLRNIHSTNDLGHPLCDNLRQGDWMPEYVAHRLQFSTATQELSQWYRDVFALVKDLPRYLMPCYFDAIITATYTLVQKAAWNKMPPVLNMSSFAASLALGSLQMVGAVGSAQLAPLAPSVLNNRNIKDLPLLAAGLPHFAQGYMRCWGRDTFISLPGLLLLTARYDDARNHILSFAGCLRHGLIPNLLNGGTGARFNCRDAVWFWLYSIKEYIKSKPDNSGLSILSDQVLRLYPSDEPGSEEDGNKLEPLHAVMQEALQRHAGGIKYRERNAGHSIDSCMKDEGFNVEVGVDWKTGFVFGGHRLNCGTWMDKMGSSDKAANKGIPATPRCGSPVELVGLSKSVVSWLSQMSTAKRYPYDGVDATIDDQKVHVTFESWARKIQSNFERYFWIGRIPSAAAAEQRPDLINRRAMYKDTLGSDPDWADYQLRPNFPIAMTVAPEIFTPSNAWEALKTIEEHLAGPLGMRTLDPNDYQYNGNYFNGDDSHDFGCAKGFNYHQGPEWVWPYGYFLRAKLHFARKLESQRPGIFDATVYFVRNIMSRHHQHLLSSPWVSLPELTNQDGQYCADGCPAQAWSMGCLLEVLHDLDLLQQ